MDEGVASEEAERTGGSKAFTETLNRIRLKIGPANGKGNRSPGMFPKLDGHGMVGKDSEVDRLVFQSGANRSNNFGIEVFDRLQFEFQIAEMGTLVDRFDMDIDKVMIFQCGESGIDLALVIGIDESGGTGDVDHGHFRTLADSFDDIDGADDGATTSGIEFAEGGEIRAASGAPGPDPVGWRGLAVIERMVGEECGSRLIESFEKLDGVGGFRRIIRGRELQFRKGEVLRGVRFEVVDFVGKLLSVEHEEVPIADAGVEGNFIIAEFLLKRGDQPAGDGVVDVTGGIVPEEAVGGNIYQVAPEGDIVGAEGNLLADGFDRTASRIIPFGIKSEHGHICDVGGGRQSFRKGQKGSVNSFTGDFIHGGGGCGFEGGFPAEFSQRLVSHAISEKNNSFTVHDYSSFERISRTCAGEIPVIFTILLRLDFPARSSTRLFGMSQRSARRRQSA